MDDASPPNSHGGVAPTNVPVGRTTGGMVPKRRTWPPPGWASVLLCLSIFAIFFPGWDVAFINLDDSVYVLNNGHLKNGLTSPNLLWAFGSLDVYWHPATWVSHMLDWDLWGSSAQGHRFTNVFLHGLAVAALCAWLRPVFGLSAVIVAGLWSLHPLRVESVAWISERKDVLSGLFGLLTLVLWNRYRDVPCSRRYGWAVLAYGFALMSKPTIVVLPLALLLLDFWPLRRELKWTRLIVEKLPLFALSLAVSALTIIGQRDTGALALIQAPLSMRLQNAIVCTLTYLGKMIWPANLAAFYPYPSHIDAATVAASATLLIGISAVAIWQRNRRPYLLFGWLWYLLFLLPVIGIIQAGRQSMGDRFTYWPMIGIVIAMVAAVQDWLRDRPAQRKRAPWATICVVAVVAVITWRQVGYWHDSVTLFEHSLAAGGDNEYIRGILAATLMEQGRYVEAKPHLEAAIRMAPERANHHKNLALVLLQSDSVEAAREQAVTAATLAPGDWHMHDLLARILLRSGNYQSAVDEFKLAAQLGADRGDAASQLNDRAAALAQAKQLGEAEFLLRAALDFQPGLIAAHKNLGLVLMDGGRMVEARNHVNAALAQFGPSPILDELASHLNSR